MRTELYGTGSGCNCSYICEWECGKAQGLETPAGNIRSCMCACHRKLQAERWWPQGRSPKDHRCHIHGS